MVCLFLRCALFTALRTYPHLIGDDVHRCRGRDLTP